MCILFDRYRYQSGVFHDVKDTTVEVLAVVDNADAQKWLDKEGTSDARSRSRES